MASFMYNVFAIVRSGFEHFLIPAGIVLRTHLWPPVQFLDAAFRQCGPDNAVYITQLDGYPQPPGTVFLEKYSFHPIDIQENIARPLSTTEDTGLDSMAPGGSLDLHLNAVFELSSLFGCGNAYDDCTDGISSKALDSTMNTLPQSLTTTSLPPATAEPVPAITLSTTKEHPQSSDRTSISTPDVITDKGKPPVLAKTTATAVGNSIQKAPVKPALDETELTPYQITRGSDGYYALPPKSKRPVQATNFLINPKAIKHIKTRNESDRKSFIFQMVLPFHSTETMEIGTDELKDILSIIVKRCAEGIIYHNKALGAFDSEFQILLREKLSKCPHIFEIRYSGWVVSPSGSYCFCEDGGTAPEDNIIFRSGFAFRRGDITRTEQQIAEAGWGILKLANLETIGVPFLFAHLGLLFHLFEAAGYSPRTLLFIEGPTGSLKTAVAALLFNFSGLPEQNIPATFRDTSASMEVKFAKYRDRVLLVDDFCPAADKASSRIMNATLEQLVRLFGDGIAKGRATPSMDEVKELKPCGLVAMTGEDSAGSQSSLLRCLFLPVVKDSFDKDLLHRYQTDPSLWTEYLAQFVKQIAPEAPAAIQYIRKRFPEYRTKAERYLSEKRLVDTFACLSITADLAVMMAQKHMPIDNAFRINLHDAVLAVCQASELKAKTVSPVRIFSLKLLALVQQNKVHLTTASEFSSNPDQYLGFERDGFWFLWPDDTYAAVCRAYQATGKIFPKSQTALWGDLVSAGVLIPTKTRRKNGTERLEYGTKTSFGDRPRMLKLVPERLRAIAEDEST